MNDKWMGQKYDASSKSILEALKEMTPKCKNCGSEKNLGTVYKEIIIPYGPYFIKDYGHAYFLCEKC